MGALRKVLRPGAGNGALELPDGTRIGALSNLVGVVIVQLLTEGIARRMLAAGVTPPVYLPDGGQANAANSPRTATGSARSSPEPQGAQGETTDCSRRR